MVDFIPPSSDWSISTLSSPGWAILGSLHLIGRFYDSRLGVSVPGSLLKNREPAPEFRSQKPGTLLKISFLHVSKHAGVARYTFSFILKQVIMGSREQNPHRVPGSWEWDPHRVLKHWEPYFKSSKTENLGRIPSTWELSAGFIPRNLKPGVGSVPWNPGIHNDLSQNERKSTVNLNWFFPISIFHFSSLQFIHLLKPNP